MTPAENLYRVLLRLYPRDHRQAYGDQMQRHARDLELAARQCGRLSVAVLYLRLIGDGLYNAAAEHVQAIGTAGNTLTPTPWPAVFLAAIPGLWIALTRRHADILSPAFSILGTAYLVLLVIAVPISWRRERQFPVWALIPIGLMAWMLVFHLGMNLVSLAGPPVLPGLMSVTIALLNGLLAMLIFSTLLHGRRLPGAALIVIGLMLLSTLPQLLYLYKHARWNGSLMYEQLAGAFYGPFEALMLVAVGLLAARRHKALALLVVIGGYGAIFLDSDYLWGSPYRDWPYLPLYLAGMVLLFFVLAPVGLLRAKTRIRQAAALFMPAVLFLTARLAVPALVLGPAAQTYFGDILISANILLALSLGWVLYGGLGDSEFKNRPAKPQLST